MFGLTVADRIATLTLERPPVNAMNEEWVAGFHRLLDGLEPRNDWTVLHLRSRQKVFSAGADLQTMKGRFESPDGIAELIDDTIGYQRLFARIEALPRVTLAEIGGAALGGGFELALACDLRLAATTVKLGLPEVRLGLIPGAGGTQRLTRLCGRAITSRLILGAEMLDGATALALGLVQWAVPPEALAEKAQKIARQSAMLPLGALARAKACIAAAAPLGAAGFEQEVRATAELLATPETRGLVAAFLNRS